MFNENNEIEMFKDTLSGLGLEEYAEDAAILNLLTKGMENFSSNAAHMKVYENLTSNKLKCHTLLIWAVSCDTDNEALWSLLNRLKQSFSNGDWQELIRTTDNVTAKIEYAKKLEEEKMELNKNTIIDNLEIIGEVKGLNVDKAVCLVDFSDDAHLEANIEKVVDSLKVNKETVLSLNLKALNSYKIKMALYLDSMLTRTKQGSLKWYEVSEVQYGAVKSGRSVAVCDLPMIDAETGLFTSPASGEAFEFVGKAVTAELKDCFGIINVVYQKPSRVPETFKVEDCYCSNIPKNNDNIDVFHEIVLWDKNKDMAYSLYCGVEGKDGDLEEYANKFSDYVIDAAKETLFCVPVDVIMDDILGL